MTPTSRYLVCQGRELHVTEWGSPQSQVVVAWHGLARTGRDMDDIAAHLAQRWRVICPDTLGHGLSQWSPAPDDEYHLGFYAAQAVDLLDQLGIGQCHWLGTSLGGAIGLRAAAGALRGRVQRLVMNDIGPELAALALHRLRGDAGSPPAFDTMGALEQHFRSIYQPCGAMTDAHWRRLAETSARRLPDGRLTPHHDPAVARQFVSHPQDFDQWGIWDALPIPVLVLRGADSDLLLPGVAEAMRTRGPRAVVVTIPGCGHAPALNTPAQFALVERFFAG
ncbi:MAG: alpha/beta hydrolase [Aquabacterium sp.]|nr:alpha/beta hydrolase [Aquabacterium sp.]